MPFNADIQQKFTIEEVNLEKTKISKKKLIQKVKSNLQPKFTLILDKFNLLLNNWAQFNSHPNDAVDNFVCLCWSSF